MNFMLIIGPQAVGKMTVGEEISKRTSMKLFHNHMSIEPFLEYFDYYESKDLIVKYRQMIFEKFIELNKYDLIFTYVYAFNQESDKNYINKLLNLFQDHNVYIVELNASLDERLKRNITENRLKKKPSKRNIEWSSSELITTFNENRLISFKDEIQHANYTRILTDNLSAEDTAKLIIKHFKL